MVQNTGRIQAGTSRHTVSSILKPLKPQRPLYSQELPYLLRAREDGRARIVFAVVSDSHWEETPLKDIQAAHDTSAPLDALTKAKRNTAIKSICKQLMQSG